MWLRQKEEFLGEPVNSSRHVDEVWSLRRNVLPRSVGEHLRYHRHQIDSLLIAEEFSSPSTTGSSWTNSTDGILPATGAGVGACVMGGAGEGASLGRGRGATTLDEAAGGMFNFEGARTTGSYLNLLIVRIIGA